MHIRAALLQSQYRAPDKAAAQTHFRRRSASVVDNALTLGASRLRLQHQQRQPAPTHVDGNGRWTRGSIDNRQLSINDGWIQLMRKAGVVLLECANCGAGFPALTGRARYCSGACRTAAWNSSGSAAPASRRCCRSQTRHPVGAGAVQTVSSSRAEAVGARWPSSPVKREWSGAEQNSRGPQARSTTIRRWDRCKQVGWSGASTFSVTARNMFAGRRICDAETIAAT